MNPSPDYIALIMLQRDRELRNERLARALARARECCELSRFQRIIRTLRPSPSIG